MKQLKWPISLFSLCAVVQKGRKLRKRKRWNGWSKSIFLENKVVRNFDCRRGAKKSGHLDYPFKSYGPKFVSMHKTCGEVGVKKKSHGYNFQFQASIWIEHGSHMVLFRSYSYQKSKLKIVAVGFFFNAAYFWGQIENFRVVWLWAPITPLQKL